MQFDRHGNRIWRQAQTLLDSEHVRRAVGEVAVPFGVCAEPSNVTAGGGACPFRFRCAGCDHFRTDVSYLPDLHAYLDDLLRTRERLLAATDDSTTGPAPKPCPSDQEISRIRRLISQISASLDELTADERPHIDQAVAVVRRHRATKLGMPAHPPGRCPTLRPGANHMTSPATAATSAMSPAAAPTPPAAASGSSPPIAAPPAATRSPYPPSPRAPVSTAHFSTATATCSNTSTPSKPNHPTRPAADPPSAGHRCTPTCSLPSNAPPGWPPAPSNSKNAYPNCSANKPGTQQDSAHPADIDQLHQHITPLEQQTADLRLQLEERDQDLAAARAANREFMTQLNSPANRTTPH